MPTISWIITLEVQLFLLALFGIVAVQMLTGKINTKGLLCGKGADGSLSPERVQLLAATFAAAFEYLSKVLRNPTPTQLPDVPENWLLLFGGSQALYLGRRLYQAWSAKQKSP
jgi:hypothetical protein